MADHITHDSIYNTVDRDDFISLIEVERYAYRTDAFDSIISATVDHFWDPNDPRYIDFEPEFDLENDTILPRELQPSSSARLASATTRAAAPSTIPAAFPAVTSSPLPNAEGRPASFSRVVSGLR